MNQRLAHLGLCAIIFTTEPIAAHAQVPPGRFFGPEGYPAEAIRLEQQGRVVLHLVISTDGSVRTCSVATSSGSPSLDAGACDTALHKVHFRPALNDAGQPVESTYELKIRYVLPNDSPPAQSPGASTPDDKTSATPAHAP
jgi:TonB family protein